MSAAEERPIDRFGRRIAQAHALSQLLSSREAYDVLQEFDSEVYINCAWLLEQTIAEAMQAMDLHRDLQRQGARS